MTVFWSNTFKKDYKILIKQGIDKKLIEYFVSLLARGERLDSKYQNHKLVGEYTGFQECHIKPDLLIIYQINQENNELYLARIGSHSRLF